MRVAIVGAGALGCVYGARLARFGGCAVTVVARSERAGTVERLERVDDGEALAWDTGAVRASVPSDTDVVLVLVRYDQLLSVPERLVGSSAPVVVMTPMLPRDHARLGERLGDRLLAAMPSVVAYRNDANAVRYWLPRVATTRIEQGAPPRAEAELVARLARADIQAQLDAGVLSRNVATTVSFLPLALALDAAGGVDALLADAQLLELAFDAAAEGRALGKKVGKAEAWAGSLLRFVGPRTARLGIGMARSRAPEALAYVEHHFGRKLHAQNVAMAEAMLELAQELRVTWDALASLLVRLRAPTG